MATFNFGVDGDTNLTAGTYGILQDFAYTYSSEEATAKNAVGDVAAQTIFNEVTEVECNYIFDSTTTAPVPGDTIVIGATNRFTVMNVGKNEVNVEYTKLKINLKRYTAVGIPAN